MIRRIRQRHPRWLLIVLLSLLLFLWVDNPLTQVFFLFTAGLTALAWLWTAAARPRQVTCTVSPERVFAGQPVQTHVHVDGGWLPLPWVQLADLSPAWPRPPAYVRSLMPRRQLTCVERVVPVRRGVYPLGPAVASWGDPFGLFETQHTFVPPAASVVVYPRVVSLVYLPVPVRQPFGVRRPRPEAFEDLTAPSDQRPYRPGDSLRRVNWKTTARLGELYTREYDYTATTDIHIFLDLASSSYVRSATGVANDEPAAELAAAVAEYGLRRGFGVSLTTYAPDRLHVPLRRGRQQLQPFLDALATAEATGVTAPAAALQREEAHIPPLATVVAVSPDTSPEFAAALARLWQRRARVLVLTVVPAGGRASPRWHDSLQAQGIGCYSVSGPEQLNEGGASPWAQPAQF